MVRKVFFFLSFTHLGAHMVSIIQMGSDGSSMAMPMLAMVMAPENNFPMIYERSRNK